MFSSSLLINIPSLAFLSSVLLPQNLTSFPGIISPINCASRFLSQDTKQCPAPASQECLACDRLPTQPGARREWQVCISWLGMAPLRPLARQTVALGKMMMEFVRLEESLLFCAQESPTSGQHG